MRIGRVEIPAISSIDKKPEKDGPLKVDILGILFKNTTYTDELDHQVENVNALREDDLSGVRLIRAHGLDHPVTTSKKAAYNRMNYAGQDGYLAVGGVEAPKSAEIINMRELKMSGVFFPHQLYKKQLRLSQGDQSITNDWDLKGRPITKLPPNYSNLEGGTELFSVTSEDGSVKIVDALALDKQQWIDDTGLAWADQTSKTRVGFHFKLGADYDNIVKVDIQIKKTGSPEHNSVANAVDTFNDIIVELFAVDGSNLPTGSALGTYTISVNTLTTSYQTINCWLNAYGLTGGNTYAATFRETTETIDASNYYTVKMNDDAGDQIANSDLLQYNGSAWSEVTGYQVLFRSYSLPSKPAVAYDAPVGDEILGDVTIWDTNSTTVVTATHLGNKSDGTTAWSRVENKEHVFDFSSGLFVIENGLIALHYGGPTGRWRLQFYDGSAWVLLDADHHWRVEDLNGNAVNVDTQAWENITIQTLTQEYCKIRIDYNDDGTYGIKTYEILEMWAGKQFVKKQLYNKGTTQLRMAGIWLNTLTGRRFGYQADGSIFDGDFDTTTETSITTSDDNVFAIFDTSVNVVWGGVLTEADDITFSSNGSVISSWRLEDGSDTAKSIDKDSSFAPLLMFAIPLTTSALLIDLDDVERGSGDGLTSGEDNWTEATTGWTASGATDGTVDADSGTVQVGTYSIACTRNATGWIDINQQPGVIDVSGYKAIELWMQGDNGANEGYLTIYLYDGADSWNKQVSSGLSGTTFEKITVSLPTNSDDMGWTKGGTPDITTINRVMIKFYNSTDTTGEVRVDGLCFSRIVDASDNVIGGPVSGHFTQHSDSEFSGGNAIKTAADAQDGDEFRLTDVNVPVSGRYKMFLRIRKSLGQGILDMYCDDDQDGRTGDPQIGSCDMYNATTITATTCEIADAYLTAGNHDFYFVIDGQNASATGYKVRFDYLLLVPYSNDQNLPADIAQDCMREDNLKRELKVR